MQAGLAAQNRKYAIVDGQRPAAGIIDGSGKGAVAGQTHVECATGYRGLAAIGGSCVDRQCCRAGSCHHRVDIDVIGCGQRQGIGAPGYRVIDVDATTTVGVDRAAGRLNDDVA